MFGAMIRKLGSKGLRILRNYLLVATGLWG